MLLKQSIIEKPKRFNLVEYFCSSGREAFAFFISLGARTFCINLRSFSLECWIIFLGKKPVFHTDRIQACLRTVRVLGNKPKSRVNCNEKYYYILIISSFVCIHRRVFPLIRLRYRISYRSVIWFSLQEKRRISSMVIITEQDKFW